MMNERKRRFADAYARLGNGTRAALEAGYEPRNACAQGSRLLRDADVVASIEAKKIRREIHGEETYRNLIALTNAALLNAQRALNPESGADWTDKARSIEAARRCADTLAKVEGLMVERVAIDHRVTHTLQDLVQKAVVWRQAGILTPVEPALETLPTPAPEIDAVFRPKPGEAEGAGERPNASTQEPNGSSGNGEAAAG